MLDGIGIGQFVEQLIYSTLAIIGISSSIALVLKRKFLLAIFTISLMFNVIFFMITLGSTNDTISYIVFFWWPICNVLLASYILTKLIRKK